MLLMVHCVLGSSLVTQCPYFCLSSISLMNREPFAQLYLFSCCRVVVIVHGLFQSAPWVCLWSMIVTFPGHAYLSINNHWKVIYFSI